MSREAQAAREKQARIILGQAEMEIANSFQEAAKWFHDNPTALHLRAMNMLYEGLKEKGALMLIPSSAVESMGMGGMLAQRPCGRLAHRRERADSEAGIEPRIIRQARPFTAAENTNNTHDPQNEDDQHLLHTRCCFESHRQIDSTRSGPAWCPCADSKPHGRCRRRPPATEHYPPTSRRRAPSGNVSAPERVRDGRCGRQATDDVDRLSGSQRPRAVVVVIQEIFGLSDWVRGVAINWPRRASSPWRRTTSPDTDQTVATRGRCLARRDHDRRRRRFRRDPRRLWPD